MFKNLKSLFVIEEENPKEPKAQPVKQKAQSKSEKTSAPAGNQPTETAPGKVTQKFLNVLFKAMEQNNLDGFDYLEFKNSLNSLKKMPMDEPTRYRSAFAMAQTMGANPEKLIQTAEHYLNVLKQEENKFEQALVKQKDLQINTKKVEIRKLEDEIKAKAQQIKKLTEEIERDQKKMTQLQSQIQNASVKVESTKSDFIVSYNALVGQIHQDVENMKNFLK